MVVLSKPAMEQFCIIKNSKVASFFTGIPVVDLSKPESENQLVQAFEEFGFCKVVNHGIPIEFISKLESEATKFFNLPLSEKEKAGPLDPFGYGNKKIGRNGDVGWVEYILLNSGHDFDYQRFESIYGIIPDIFRCAVNDYLISVKKMACEILELTAKGLKINEKNVFSKLIMDEQSDSAFRLNHYPRIPDVKELHGKNLIGFGEHTDPQIISILRSNEISGLQIALKDGTWIPVTPNHNSFFVNIGDSMQVMTNGRFKSVKHRVMANRVKSRLSMIYFGGPPLSEKIAPLPSLIKENEERLYKEFTWLEYKMSAFKSRLADNRLEFFEIKKNSNLIN